MNASICGRTSPFSAQKNQFTEKNCLHHPQSPIPNPCINLFHTSHRKNPEKSETNKKFIEKKCLTVAEMRKKAFEFIILAHTRTHTLTQFSPANDNDDSAFLSLCVANIKINYTYFRFAAVHTLYSLFTQKRAASRNRRTFIRTHKAFDAHSTLAHFYRPHFRRVSISLCRPCV